MKGKIIIWVFAAFFIAATSISCNKQPSSPAKATKVTGTLYKVVRSEARWTAYLVKDNAELSHFGNLKIGQGEVLMQDGLPKRGEFVADMTTVTDEDLDTELKREEMAIFLKGPDFFDTGKFKTAFLTITDAKRVNTGNYNTLLDGTLTVKAITIPVQFHANVFLENDTLKIFSEPTEVNRKDFGLKYQLASKLGKIKKEMTLQLTTQALRK